MIYTGPSHAVKKYMLSENGKGRQGYAFDKSGRIVEQDDSKACINFWLPPEPLNIDVINIHKPKEEQIWSRVGVPKELPDWEAEEYEAEDKGFDGVVSKEYEEFKKHEWNRRVNGVWIMINGEKKYLTGKQWFYLQWCKLDVGYPNYYDELRWHYYFVERALEDVNCFGYMTLGPRGVGKSSVEASILLEESTRPPHNSKFGIQSKTDDDAKSLLVSKMVPMFNNLPKHFKPMFDNSSRAQNTLSFFRHAQKGKAARKVSYGESKELGNLVSYYPAKEYACDGETFRWHLSDEIGKTDPTHANVRNRTAVNRFTVDRNVGKIGMLAHTSTVEEMEEGGMACHQLWKDSNMAEIDEETMTTKSGMWRRYSPIQESDSRFRDKFGIVHSNKVIARQQAYRRTLENEPDQLASWIRKNPMNEHEMFYTESNSCEFDSVVLNNQLTKVLQEENFVRGKLVWKNGKRFSEVVWVPVSKGPFKATSFLPPKEQLNQVGHKYVGGNRLYAPKQAHKFAIGVDPVEHGTIDGKKSLPVALAKTKFDPLVDPTGDGLSPAESRKVEYKSNRYFLMYDDRPANPNEFFENVLKMCWFLGTKAHIENNRSSIINYFINHKMQEFLLKRPKETMGPATRRGYGSPGQKQVIQQYTTLIESYVAFFGHTIEFPELLTDLLEFNPKKTTKYDYAVSMGFCELACLDQETASQPDYDFDIEQAYGAL